MAEPLIVSQLTTKRNEIEGRITAYEREIERCQRDLAALNATLSLFQFDGVVRPTVSVSRMFKRGELFRFTLDALQAAGEPLDTRELAGAILEAKGFDPADKVMRKAVALNIVQTLTMRAKRGQIVKGPKRKGVAVWGAAD